MRTEKTHYGIEVPTAVKVIKRDDSCTCMRNSDGFILSYDPWCLSPLKFKHGKQSTKRKKKLWTPKHS